MAKQIQEKKALATTAPKAVSSVVASTHTAAGSKSNVSLKARATDFLLRHPIFTTIFLTGFIFVSLVVLVWYTVFSGIASSADFIYSNF